MALNNGKLMEEGLKEIDAPLRVLIVGCFIVISALGIVIVRLNYKVDETITRNEVQMKADLVNKDSTIEVLRRDKQNLINQIYIITDSYNKERIQFIEQTLEKIDKIKKIRKQ